MLNVRQLSARTTGQSLTDLSFRVETGEILAIIGSEQCGKHLLAQALSGQIQLKDGVISVNHYRLDAQPIKSRCQLGYLANPPSLEEFLSGYEYLDIVGATYHISPTERQNRIGRLIGELDFAEGAYSVIERVSPATRQKIALAAALVHQPEVLIVEEPTTNLDFDGQSRAIKLLKDEAPSRATVLISDNLSLAEELADRFLLLENGAVLAEGTMKTLLNQVGPAVRDLSGIYQTIFR